MDPPALTILALSSGAVPAPPSLLLLQISLMLLQRCWNPGKRIVFDNRRDTLSYDSRYTVVAAPPASMLQSRLQICPQLLDAWTCLTPIATDCPTCMLDPPVPGFQPTPRRTICAFSTPSDRQRPAWFPCSLDAYRTLSSDNLTTDTLCTSNLLGTL